MTSLKHLAALAVLAATTVVNVHPAAAQLVDRTWVSRNGDNTNVCNSLFPCLSLSGALAKTRDGGVIVVQDAGAYASLTITKSVTIIGADAVGTILNPLSGAIAVSGANIDVVLKNLDIDGGASGGASGIYFQQGNSLVVDNVRIGNQTTGIYMNVGAGTSKLVVRNSTIVGNGIGTTGAGIQIAPLNSGSANVTIVDSVVSNNVLGIRADSNATTGTIDLAITDTVTSENAYHGIVALASTGRVTATVTRSHSSNNAGEGIRAVGANALIRLGGSTVIGNGTGIVSASGGRIQSYGDNQINGNTADGAAPTIIGLK